MKCYYHSDRDAVATCQQCGRGFCQECFDERLSDGLCDECRRNGTQSKSKESLFQHEDALVDTVSEFVITSIFGIALGVLFVWLIVKDDVPQITDFSALAEYIELFLVGYFLPFGWRLLDATGFLSGLFNLSFYATGPVGITFSLLFLVIKLLLKLFLCVLLGPICFAYQIIRWIVLRRRLHKRKNALQD